MTAYMFSQRRCWWLRRAENAHREVAQAGHDDRTVPGADLGQVFGQEDVADAADSARSPAGAAVDREIATRHAPMPRSALPPGRGRAPTP
jgi:hypothetical protein